MSNSTTALPGVVLLSDALIFNNTLPPPSFANDELADINNYLILGVPFLALFFGGIGFVSYYTDEDGYVVGHRTIESLYVWYRYITTLFFTYAIEGLQLTAVAFGPASTRAIVLGAEMLPIFRGFLFQGGNFFTAFPIICAVQLLFVIFMTVPMVLWKTLPRDLYEKFEEFYVKGRLGLFISLMQDLYMNYLTMPFFITLFSAIPCEYFVTGEPDTALEKTTECGSIKHLEYAITGACIAIVSFVIGVTAGTVPVLVKRSTDIALNGRYNSIAFAIKACLAMCYVLFNDRHQYFHLGSVLFLQCALLFMNISLRPCLVERINFHRSAAICFSIIPSGVFLVASGLDDILNPIPRLLAIVSVCCIIVMLLIKYFLIPCGKLFPAMDFEVDGEVGAYEGGIVLGWGLPHGHGIIRWPEQQKMFAGSFIFGLYHGYGVETQFKLFFQGMHHLGKREGYGVTNIMEEEDEEYFEGMFANSKYHGYGIKKWKDKDLYEGYFEHGVEHGTGKWSFETEDSGKKYDVEGEFEQGVFTLVQLEEHETYEGDKRYGVPHGLGTLQVDDDVSDGEWRAGKLHGHGSLRTAAGEYEGIFIQGAFNEEGTWKDDAEIYKGGWKDGMKHGQGVQEMIGCGVYDGQFYEDNRHGYGTFTYADNTEYQGSWFKNDYHGSGLLTTSDGAQYDGNWHYGERHGTRGCITYPTGETYVGSWEHNEYHGQGILKIPDMGEYNGKFEFGKRHGLGRMTFYDGSQFVGDWSDDFAHGEGTFVFASRKAIRVMEIMSIEDASLLQTSGDRIFLDFGGVYKGQFANGTMNGEGNVTCGDGTVFTGEWMDGLPHGSGTLELPGGGVYEGEFFGGLRDGIGKMTFADARIYRGSWEEGKRHGHGVMFSAQGDILHDCEWNRDVPDDGTTGMGLIEEVPEVDVEEFLRAILPNQGSEEEIEEHQERRRIEIHAQSERAMIHIVIEEELLWRRLMKAFILKPEHFGRLEVDSEEVATFRDDAKPFLIRLLNQWKAEFRTENGREPKKSDILKDPSIAPLYRTYMEIK